MPLSTSNAQARVPPGMPPFDVKVHYHDDGLHLSHKQPCYIANQDVSTRTITSAVYTVHTNAHSCRLDSTAQTMLSL